MTQNNHTDLDPFGPWRQLRDATMDVWAKSMAEAVNTEAFAQNMGAYLNTYLATSAPLQKFVEQYMEATLSRLSMPSRDEVLDLARRMTSVEMRLDDIDAKIDRIARLVGAKPAPAGGDDVAARLSAIEQSASRLLSAVEALAARPAAETPAPKPAAAPAAKPAAKPAAASGRTRKKKASAPTAAEKSAQDVADDTAIEPFQNANA